MSGNQYFSFTWRNPGHWDVFAETGPGRGKERAFCIRGGPHEKQWGGDGAFRIRDERELSSREASAAIAAIEFASLDAAVAFITSILMAENGA